MDYFIDSIWQFLQYFWSVFTFWTLWQFCDWTLSKLRIKLRKPWILGSKKENDDPLQTEE